VSGRWWSWGGGGGGGELQPEVPLEPRVVHIARWTVNKDGKDEPKGSPTVSLQQHLYFFASVLLLLFFQFKSSSLIGPNPDIIA